MKTISKQLRQKSRAKQQDSTPENKRNARKGGNTKTEAINTEKITEETVSSSFNVNGTVKSTDNTEEQEGNGKEGEEPMEGTHAPLASVNMESRAITLANELKVKDLARVVSLLARWNSRNEPLLNACLHRLSLADLSSFTPSQLSSLLQVLCN